MSMGLFDPNAVNWQDIAGLVRQRGSHRLLHVPPSRRTEVTKAAGTVGLITSVVDPYTLELRLREPPANPADGPVSASGAVPREDYDDFLREHYPNRTAAAISKELGRSVAWVYNRARALGLTGKGMGALSLALPAEPLAPEAAPVAPIAEVDEELGVLAIVVREIEKLAGGARARILRYLMDRYQGAER